MNKPSLFRSLSRVKAVFIGCLLLILLSGCSGGKTAPPRGDFAFDLPEGYSVSDVTDESCSIVREQDGVAVGGIEATGLKPGDLKKRVIDEDAAEQFHSIADVD